MCNEPKIWHFEIKWIKMIACKNGNRTETCFYMWWQCVCLFFLDQEMVYNTKWWDIWSTKHLMNRIVWCVCARARCIVLFLCELDRVRESVRETVNCEFTETNSFAKAIKNWITLTIVFDLTDKFKVTSLVILSTQFFPFDIVFSLRVLSFLSGHT